MGFVSWQWDLATDYSKAALKEVEVEGATKALHQQRC
jgi:hypothetical protein